MKNILKILKTFIFYFILLWLLSSLAVGLFESFRVFYFKDILKLVLGISLACLAIDFVCNYFEID